MALIIFVGRLLVCGLTGLRSASNHRYLDKVSSTLLESSGLADEANPCSHDRGRHKPLVYVLTSGSTLPIYSCNLRSFTAAVMFSLR
jgi:hypothetical protein